MDAKQNVAGFTLVEILLVIALIGVIAFVTAPIAFSIQNSTNIQTASDVIKSSWRDAQSLARAASGNDNWGVHIASGSVVIFRGSTYATRITSYDKTYSIAQNIQIAASPSSMSDVIFYNTSGSASATGVVTLTLSNLTRTITLNEKGGIQ